MDAPSRNAQAFAAVPFMALLGVQREFSAGGRARLVVETRPELENPIRAMHGGVVATLVDVVMASAAVSRIDFAKTAVTLTMNTSYLQPGRGRLTADGEVLGVDADGEVVQCAAWVTDSEGRVVARSLGSFRYLDNR
ncbi:PaaI family thioesterase [Variovorax ginsengisoli]|uniref:PaaI family thioesterase n=1 Tax=Variovorax ginsengisoli TaxID=363844 RepID=A0ABT8SHN2_9BURK|nr:PaaI family thioesterase [Variovorax ginsengisoli]MDN8618347.1 PaaI family thioesterase [Variovorax ginsengisoli]MDO1537517.1 PaaI family thioesterase [Variovorax ginsengisoli]